MTSWTKLINGGRSRSSSGETVRLTVQRAGKSGVYKVQARGVLGKKQSMTTTVRTLPRHMAKLATEN